MYPLTFHPIFKERVWGGRALEELFGKRLPAKVLIGESWEISDRPNDESTIANGKFAGKSLRWLMDNFKREILGDARPANGNRFPILCKILDAREKLSVQVHPSAEMAGKLKGEPKTEMWFIAQAPPGAELFAGLKRGVARAEFEKRICDGSVADCLHRVPVREGDALFLPSGRVHAIGGGLVIFEIQQNSDTTYRVFDWNRTGLDGKPRELHVAQSLESINFTDFEPALIETRFAGNEEVKSRVLVRHALFCIEQLHMKKGATHPMAAKSLQIAAVVRGRIEIQNGKEKVDLSGGRFCLIPAALETTRIMAKANTVLLRVEAGR